MIQDLSDTQGLSEDQAFLILKTEGYNELPSDNNSALWSLLWETIQDPIFLLLLGGGIVYFFLGDLHEALILIGFVLFIVGISFYQEGKTEHALKALKDLSSPRALVIRDGKQRRIAGREVVCGDLLVLVEGDRVPADALIISNLNLSVDESLLTGESVPVRKTDNLSQVYAGTLVVQGRAIAQVQATGIHTQMGKIGQALGKVKTQSTALEKEMVRIVNRLFGIAVAFCLTIVIIYGITRGDWLKATLAGITLAMAILPNEFPVVVTIFLALGAWRISKKQVLARRTSAVETLGSATVLCSDKTGTLTLNRMSAQQLIVPNSTIDQFSSCQISDALPKVLPESMHELVEFSILASQSYPFDPMERAFKQLGDRFLQDTEHLHRDWQLLREYPLSSELMAMTRVWRSADGHRHDIAAKGSAESIADLCHLAPKQKQLLFAQVATMAEAGLRVLAVAKASFETLIPPHPKPDPNHLPEHQHDFSFLFLGLIGLADPVRPTVASAIAQCYSAGIRVVMITGDSPITARTIAREIGLLQMGQILTGAELEAMDDRELESCIDSINIYARTVPEQKLRIINALKAKGEVVAMTGDGVNDAPALKAAQIGIAMGQRGTDVARESAALVLLDDDFSSIVEAIKLGRRIFDNLRKAMIYLLAIHIPIAGLSLIPVLFKLPLVLLPIHVAFLHLIIDPVCSVVLEAEPAEANLMKRPPRKVGEPLFAGKTLRLAILQGMGILVLLVLVYLFSLQQEQSETNARALAFTSLILANLSLIVSGRSNSRINLKTLRSSNPAFWWVFGSTFFFLALVLYIPFLRNLFSFSYLHPIDLLVSLLVRIVAFIWLEWAKVISIKIY